MSPGIKEVVVIILLTLVLITVLFAFYSSEGLASKVSKYVSDKALEYFKVFGFKTDNLESEVEKKAKEDFTKFYELMTAEGKNCIARGKIPANDYIIQIQDNGGLYMRLVDEDGQMLASLPQKGSGPRVVPCVIAGANNEAQNFYNCYAAKAGGCAGPFYSSSSGEITIQDGELHMGGETYDLKVSGITDDIMYIDGANRCFFAEDEWDWGTYDEDGLDGDVIRDVAQAKTKLPMCGVQTMCQEKHIQQCSDYDTGTCKDNPCLPEVRCRVATAVSALGNGEYQITESCKELKAQHNCTDYGKTEPIEMCTTTTYCTIMNDPSKNQLVCWNRQWLGRAQRCEDYALARDCNNAEFAHSYLYCYWEDLGSGSGACMISPEFCENQIGTHCDAYPTQEMCKDNICKVPGGCEWAQDRCRTECTGQLYCTDYLNRLDCIENPCESPDLCEWANDQCRPTTGR